MDIRIFHFYPDLMSLYGSYANVAVLKRYLEALGCAVSVERVLPGQTRHVGAVHRLPLLVGVFVGGVRDLCALQHTHCVGFCFLCHNCSPLLCKFAFIILP